jgi:transposase
MHIMDKPVVRTPRRRRKHTEQFKRELVARTLEPGVSVAAIAMEGGINANLLFGWRRKQVNGTTQAGDAAPVQPAAVLLPVSIETAEVDRPSIGSTSSMRASSGTIEIEIGNARVRLRGGVDEANLRTVLVALRDLA